MAELPVIVQHILFPSCTVRFMKLFIFSWLKHTSPNYPISQAMWLSSGQWDVRECIAYFLCFPFLKYSWMYILSLLHHPFLLLISWNVSTIAKNNNPLEIWNDLENERQTWQNKKEVAWYSKDIVEWRCHYQLKIIYSGLLCEREMTFFLD